MRKTWRDYVELLRGLLPTGPVWPMQPGTTLEALLDAMAQEFARIDARGWRLLEEADPRRTTELLAEWERATGLPSPCAGMPETQAERREAVVSKLRATGDQSPQYFIDLAAELGFSVTVTEFKPFRVGANAAGDRLYGPEWAFAWQVNAPSQTYSLMRVGQGAAGEPLRVWGTEQALECAIRERSPAHTVLLFNYG